MKLDFIDNDDKVVQFLLLIDKVVQFLLLIVSHSRISD